jgi:TRAP-type C4-dicarboxylate transport system permease small subunit
MPQEKFLAGLEEAIARIVSLLVSGLVVFAFWIGGDYYKSELSNPEFLIFILAFWLVYELLSFGFFQLFRFFSQRMPQNTEDETDTEETNDELSLDTDSEK